MKKNDIYSMYNDIDEMINSIDIKKEDIIDEEEKVIVIEEEHDELDEIANNEFVGEEEIEILDFDLDNKIELSDDLEKTMVFEPINEDKKDTSFLNLDETETNINKEEKLSEIDEIFNNKEESVEENKEKKVKKEKVRKNKEKTSNKKWVITFGILDSLAVVCLFLMYGPISYFRNLWVTSAMTTATHQYLAYIFFNDSAVKNIMDNNIVIESNDNTNKDDISHAGEDTGVYESIYDEQVLKRTPGNNLYKVIDIEGDGYKGHMIVVYDASRVKLFEAPNINYGGKQMDKMVELAGAYAGINASGFAVTNGGLKPAGVVIMDGKVVHDNGATGWGGGIIGFTNDNVLVLTKSSGDTAVKMGIRDGMSFGPFLIVNGEPSQFKGNGGYGIAPRTAIGQRKDGIVLLLVIDGRRPGHSLGVDMVELTNIMLKYGAYNASNLDGGGSSSMAVDGKIINVAGGSGYSGDRYLPNAWVVK